MENPKRLKVEERDDSISSTKRLVRDLLESQHLVKFRQISMMLNDEDFDCLNQTLREMTEAVNDARIARRNLMAVASKKSVKSQDVVLAVPTASSRRSRVPGNTSSSSTIPSEVLRQLTVSKFLTSEELGRLLLRTSKSISSSLSKEYIWQNMCLSRWPHSPPPPKSLISQRGYKWYFRQLTASPSNANGSTSVFHRHLSPPKLKIQDLLLVISIRHPQRGELLSATLKGEQLNQLFVRQGELEIRLAQNNQQSSSSSSSSFFCLGDLPVTSCTRRFDNDENQRYFQDTDIAALFRNWKVTAHLFRLDTNACCCLHDAHNIDEFRYHGRFYDRARYINTVSKFVPAQGTIHVVGTSNNRPYCWDWTEQGRCWIKLVQKHAQTSPRYQFSVSERTVRLAMKFPSTRVRLLQENGKDDVARVEAESFKLEIKNFADLDPQNGHGVSMLHLLEELKGWNH